MNDETGYDLMTEDLDTQAALIMGWQKGEKKRHAFGYHFDWLDKDGAPTGFRYPDGFYRLAAFTPSTSWLHAGQILQWGEDHHRPFWVIGYDGDNRCSHFGPYMKDGTEFHRLHSTRVEQVLMGGFSNSRLTPLTITKAFVAGFQDIQDCLVCGSPCYELDLVKGRNICSIKCFSDWEKKFRRGADE